MGNIEFAEFGIVVNEEQQFSVWPTHLRLPPGCRFAGPVGTNLEMQALIQQQFIETTPATYITPDGRFRNSQQAD
jgi:MbtH protein